MTIKYLLTGMSIITVFVSVTPSLAQQASAQPDVTIRWPVASQKVQAEGEWITIDESSPESDRVIIPRLFHVIREVLVSNPAADSTWQSVEMTPEIENWTIPIPAELQSAGQLRVRLRLDRPFNGFLTQPTLVPDPDGTVVLPANAAITSGEKLRFEPQAYKDTVGYWVEAGDTVAWKFSTSRAGDYDVHILQGCGSGSAGSRVAARVGDEQVDFAIEETGHFQRFVWRQVGVLKLPKKSQLTLSLHVQHKPHNAVGDVRQIRAPRYSKIQYSRIRSRYTRGESGSRGASFDRRHAACRSSGSCSMSCHSVRGYFLFALLARELEAESEVSRPG